MPVWKLVAWRRKHNLSFMEFLCGGKHFLGVALQREPGGVFSWAEGDGGASFQRCCPRWHPQDWSHSDRQQLCSSGSLDGWSAISRVLLCTGRWAAAVPFLDLWLRACRGWLDFGLILLGVAEEEYVSVKKKLGIRPFLCVITNLVWALLSKLPRLWPKVHLNMNCRSTTALNASDWSPWWFY